MPALQLLWESDRCFTVHKPAGVPVFPPHANPTGDCVLHRLDPPPRDWPQGFEGGITHRLDIPTSGQLLVARSPAGIDDIRRLFSEKQLVKRYRFLTARDVPWSTHQVEAALAHDRKHKKRMVVQRGANTPHRGRWLPAMTHFTRIGPVHGGLISWEAQMRTGVMHQIRLHAASIGLALVGDQLYGGGSWDHSRPERALFALHHLGLEGPGLQPGTAPLPDWWPQPLPSEP